MRNKNNKHFLHYVILLLLFLSVLIPIVNSIKITRVTNDENVLDDYSFDCLTFDRDVKISPYQDEISNSYNVGVNLFVNRSNQSFNSFYSDGMMDSAWPMKCHDLHHTGRSPYSTAGNPGGEKWRFQTDGYMECGMVIDNDGVIYFGGGWTIFAINSDGSLRWGYNTDGKIWSTPAIAEDGTIYIGSYDDFLYAINSDGSLKWKYDSQGSISSSPAIGDDGTVYFGNMGWTDGHGCKIFAINPDGTLKWEYQTGYKIVSDPAIGDDGTIYIGSGDDYLYAMNPNGTLKWRFKTGDYVKSHPVIGDDGTIYFVSFDDHLYALNPDGTVKWKIGNSGGASASISLGSDETIYIPAVNYLKAHNSDGTEKWKFFLGSTNFYTAHVSPAISADGTIYIGISSDTMHWGEIIAVNPDGTLRWRKYIANGCVDSSPCIGSDGSVYIGSSSDADYIESYGYLHCFSPQSNNHPPNRPSLGGRIRFNVRDEVELPVHCDGDPDNNPMSFLVDWGDDTEPELIYDLPYQITGTSVSRILFHRYDSMGTYTIKAKAVDDFGGESDWGYFIVAVSKNKIKATSFLQTFLLDHPLINQILKQIVLR